jgi:exodeoxyribonuclease-1
METTFYFYDLETSGFNPRDARIMQFAGQRLDMKLKPIGEPHNFLIKLTDDVLPDPGAVLVTGITPQATKTDGLTEAEFLKIFHEEISTPGTIFVGFNTVRFDDEFMRFLQYRNYYEPYEWQWKDGRSRWDLLDVVRMTRALRPDGIKWPLDSDGKPSNRLEILTSINGLDHADAHDALSDVRATIALAQLLRQKQPKLFNYLLDMRDKRKVAELVNSGQPFVYSSGKYPSEFEKTTIVTKLADHPERQGALVYDLRHDPDNFVKLTPEEITIYWTRKWDDHEPRLPVKTLQYNRCPAVAPLGVCDAAAQKRLKISLKMIEKHRRSLRKHPEFITNLLKAIVMLDEKQQARLLEDEQLVDAQLYEGFFDNADRKLMARMHQYNLDEQAELVNKFKDNRLKTLWPLYKARNFPQKLTDEERQIWENYRANKLTSGQPNRLTQFFDALKSQAARPGLTQQQQYLLEELQLYGESLIPDQGE